MRIIALKTLRKFYEKHRDSEQALKAWYDDARRAQWKSQEEVKRQYVSASILKGNRVVFNIKGGHYRLIVKFNYKYGHTWIRFIGTHAAYDRIDAEKI
ncbi:MAG: type II toxin-antitoxin system HigB family toxin [Chitinophagales bacterium]|nr:type II toxin-antitoxin system HigB family toxin [Chitinophagales bacterium]